MARALWFRIILFWSFLASAAVELVNYLLLFTKTSDAEPFRHARSPSKSRRRPSDIKFAFSFPTLRLGSRHSVEFEASQERLRHSVRLQRMGPRAPKRCDTPLLPLHCVPDSGSEDGHQGRAKCAMWEGVVASSPSTTPSFSLNTPLSTSSPLQDVDPFLYQRESFFTPSDHGSILNSIGIWDSFDLTEENRSKDLRYLEKPTRVLLNGSLDDTGRTGRRKFCACRQPCSDFAPVSPVADTPPLVSKRISSQTIQRRRSFDADPFADPTSKIRNFLESPLLGGLDLAAGARPLNGWTAKPWTPRHIAEIDVPSPSLSFRRSDIYDAWLSSWCFRPAVPRSSNLPVPDIIVSPVPHQSPFLSPCVSDDSLTTAPSQRTSPNRFRYGLVPGLASRSSRIVSGIHKLQNLRELLVLLDETVAATQRDLSLEGELPREDVEFSRRQDLGATVAGQAL
ncbi:hypothetical protein AGABI2DRAFT_114701 [Agaricus bisporus var. bisporus H97]|uniref:hypothetical protein n=1 Tax=Agaricus bisporus var. bisporus (strain H97 / ATCC MYA-4626 / FGSC 10389) TaxID=936046 RepID=UPI00029F5000|nr:hypothetical protein AGABI2DRAFT_114701 [Agaricus bisporus var. bisporus H97]EKV51966.1 hypothetical protein AGABI2DRAFT_114701 [Agaricus bisporus var. bisporus H97]